MCNQPVWRGIDLPLLETQHAATFRAMRLLRLGIILFQIVWMNFVLPGHTRGAITVPGWERSAGISARSCCAPNTKTDPAGQPLPTQGDRAHCALCYSMAGYSTPPVYTFDLTPQGLVEFARRCSTAPLISRLHVGVYDANGPPLA